MQRRYLPLNPRIECARMARAGRRAARGEHGRNKDGKGRAPRVRRHKKAVLGGQDEAPGGATAWAGRRCTLCAKEGDGG